MTVAVRFNLLNLKACSSKQHNTGDNTGENMIVFNHTLQKKVNSSEK